MADNYRALLEDLENRSPGIAEQLKQLDVLDNFFKECLKIGDSKTFRLEKRDGTFQEIRINRPTRGGLKYTKEVRSMLRDLVHYGLVNIQEV